MNMYTYLSSLLCDEFHHLSRDFALFTGQNMAHPFRRYTINVKSPHFNDDRCIELKCPNAKMQIVSK